MEEKKGDDAVILYGTETGTAEDVAFKVLQLSTHRKLNVSIQRMDDFDILSLPKQKLVIFVVSTSGDGEVPFNMKAFWNFLLRKGLPSDSLQKMKFAIFGLGDSSYEKFNAAARYVYVDLI